MRLTLLLILAMFINPVLAQDKVSFGGLRAQVDYQFITMVASRSDESKEQFLLRVGGIMNEYTRQTGFEACSVIYQSPSRIGVYISTNRSHIGCITVMRPPLSDMTALNESIHTHPHETRYRANKNDEILSGFKYKNKTMQNADPRTFSPTDYKSGSGYLVVDGNLHYQRGEGTSFLIGAISPPEDSVVQSITTLVAVN